MANQGKEEGAHTHPMNAETTYKTSIEVVAMVTEYKIMDTTPPKKVRTDNSLLLKQRRFSLWQSYAVDVALRRVEWSYLKRLVLSRRIPNTKVPAMPDKQSSVAMKPVSAARSCTWAVNKIT